MKAVTDYHKGLSMVESKIWKVIMSKIVAEILGHEFGLEAWWGSNRSAF